jgi:hypothetical protein
LQLGFEKALLDHPGSAPPEAGLPFSMLYPY